MEKSRRSISACLGCSVMVLLAILLEGCVTGTTKLVMRHAPLAPVAQKRQGDVLVRPFVDTRVDTKYIGNKRNGYGMIMGHVATQEGVKLDELLTQYFIEALQEAGYNAVLDKSTPEGPASTLKCDVIIDGEIVEFWMDFYVEVWHDVVVRVKAINPADQKVVWDKVIQGSERRSGCFGAKAEFERIVSEATTNALNRAAEEFDSDDFYNSAIKKQP